MYPEKDLKMKAPSHIRAVYLSLLTALILFIFSMSCRKTGPVKVRVTVTDTVGRTVEIPAPVERIICIAPGTLRLISYLEATGKLVGVESFEKKNSRGRPYRLANPQLAELPAIGPGGPVSINREPDLEKILTVKPQLIFISYMDKSKAEALQKKLGIPVVVLTHGLFATFDRRVYDSLRIAGKILDASDRAEKVISFIEGARKDLENRTRDVPGAEKSDAYVGGIGFKGSHGIVSTDAGYVPFEWVGAKNKAKKISSGSHVFIDRETLLKWNPDIIFIDGGGLKPIIEDYNKRPEFYRALKAVKNGKVYILLPYNYYVTNIGTAIVDAYFVGKVLYPRRFADVDIGGKAAEIYEFLVGKAVYEDMKKDYGAFRKLEF